MTGPIIYMLVVLGVYIVGLLYRKRTQVHWKIMTLGIVADVCLTLWLELSRGAIRQSVGVMEFEYNTTLLYYIHIPIAVLLLIDYVLVARTGYLLLNNKCSDYQSTRKRHLLFGVTTMIFYVGSLLTAPGFVIERLFFS